MAVTSTPSHPVNVSNEPLLLYADKEFLDPSVWRVGAHEHAHHELLIIQRGRQCTRLDADEVEAGPGEVLFYAAGTPHEEWLVPDGSVVKYTLGFAWDVDLSDVPSVLSDGGGRLTELADWISAEAPDTALLTPAIPEPLLHGLVGELRRAAKRTGQELKERASRVMRRDMESIRSVEQLAEVLGMSRSHLSRRFVEEVGQAPSEFLRTERLQRARFLLRSTSMAVKEVAGAVGVSSEQQLCRMIRQSYGVTTRELRSTAN